MNKDKEDLIKLRNAFRETADIIDDIVDLSSRADNGETGLEKEIESKMGLFLYKMIEISNYGG